MYIKISSTLRQSLVRLENKRSNRLPPNTWSGEAKLNSRPPTDITAARSRLSRWCCKATENRVTLSGKNTTPETSIPARTEIAGISTCFRIVHVWSGAGMGKTDGFWFRWWRHTVRVKRYDRTPKRLLPGSRHPDKPTPTHLHEYVWLPQVPLVTSKQKGQTAASRDGACRHWSSPCGIGECINACRNLSDELSMLSFLFHAPARKRPASSLFQAPQTASPPAPSCACSTLRPAKRRLLSPVTGHPRFSGLRFLLYEARHDKFNNVIDHFSRNKKRAKNGTRQLLVRPQINKTSSYD